MGRTGRFFHRRLFIIYLSIYLNLFIIYLFYSVYIYHTDLLNFVSFRTNLTSPNHPIYSCRINHIHYFFLVENSFSFPNIFLLVNNLYHYRSPSDKISLKHFLFVNSVFANRIVCIRLDLDALWVLKATTCLICSMFVLQNDMFSFISVRSVG